MAQVRDRAFNIPIRVDFDAKSNVLYVAKGTPVPSESDSVGRGVELRYALSNGAHSGVTVIGFKHYSWNSHVAELSEIIAKHIGLPAQYVHRALLRPVLVSDLDAAITAGIS